MRIERVVGVLGVTRTPIDLSPGVGVVALLGDARARSAAHSLLLSAVTGTGRHRSRLVRDARVHVLVPSTGSAFEIDVGGADEPTERTRLLDSLGLDATALALLWAGGAGPDLAVAVAGGARVVATLRGVGRIESALDALATLPHVAETLVTLRRSNADGSASRANGGGMARLERVERELQILRADAVEVQGDLDEATMEWLRERQDAETTLLAYRDRARELKTRLQHLERGGPGSECPTCGRELEDQYDSVAAGLREEWESVVQDGQWWKRRRDQLELKPERVRDLEGRSVRLHAAIEDAAERAEHIRTASGARPVGDGFDAFSSPGSPLPSSMLRAAEEIRDPQAAATTLFGLAREIEDESRVALLSATGRVLNRLSGGRLVGVEPAEGSPDSLVPRPVAGGPGPEDFVAAQVAAHIALARLVARVSAPPLGSLLVGESFARLEEEDQLRGVALLRRMRRPFPQILVMPASSVVDAVPEAFDRVWEFGTAPGSDSPAFRSLPVGVRSIRMGG